MPKKPFGLSELPSPYKEVFGEKAKSTKVLTPSKRATLVQKYSKGRCSYCKKKFDYLNLDVHHIKERSKGGSNKLTNLTILCAGCHRELKHGYIDRTKIKPIMKPKTRKRQRKTKTKKKKPSSVFDLPKTKLPKGYL
jgi:5-methylcytosine-specific restriction endonuclease McrA